MSKLLQIMYKQEQNEEQMIFEPNQINEIFIKKFSEEIDNYTDGLTKTSKIKHNHYDIFKITDSDKTVSYFVIDKKKFIGSGCFGQVYQGFDVLTKDQIVAKYGSYIGSDEIKCLKKTGLYLGYLVLKNNVYVQGIILMKKAHGKDYDQILRDPLISDQEKIQIHEKIIDKYNQLLDKHGICHWDTKSEHIFVDLIIDQRLLPVDQRLLPVDQSSINENQITIVDFGSSYFPFFRFFNSDVQQFNQNIKYYYTNTCSSTFIKHIESLIKNDDKKRKIISILSLSLRSVSYSLISLGIWIFVRRIML